MGEDDVNPSTVLSRDDGHLCTDHKQDGAPDTAAGGVARSDAGAEGDSRSPLSRTDAAAPQYRRSLFRR